MKWRVPSSGETRMRRKFAWWPITVHGTIDGDEARPVALRVWLEHVMVTERYDDFPSCAGGSRWHTTQITLNGPVPALSVRETKGGGDQ